MIKSAWETIEEFKAEEQKEYIRKSALYPLLKYGDSDKGLFINTKQQAPSKVTPNLGTYSNSHLFALFLILDKGEMGKKIKNCASTLDSLGFRGFHEPG